MTVNETDLVGGSGQWWILVLEALEAISEDGVEPDGETVGAAVICLAASSMLADGHTIMDIEHRFESVDYSITISFDPFTQLVSASVSWADGEVTTAVANVSDFADA